MEILITVRGQHARGDGTCIVCGNSGYAVRFDLDEAWQPEGKKTMLVVCESGACYAVGFTGLTAPLPALYQTGSVRIGLLAGEVCTSTGALFSCCPSIQDEAGVTREPQEGLYAQLVQAVNKRVPEPETEGTDGQVLTTDGQGGRSWRSPEAGLQAAAVQADGTLLLTLTGGQTLNAGSVRGPKGDPGAAPVKGTDYWTAADRSALVQEVLAALPDGSDTAY